MAIVYTDSIMKSAIINVKTDSKTKQAAQKLAEEIGLSLSAVINGQLKQFVRDQAITFSKPYQMSSVLEKRLKLIDDDINNGRNLYGPVKTKKELDHYFDTVWK